MTGSSREDSTTAGVHTARRWRRAELAAVVVAMLSFVNVLPNDFCDDGVAIVENNYKVNEPGQWGVIWTTDYWSDAEGSTPNRDLLYRPVALVSYRLVRLLAGVHALPHHIVNILLHALICAMVVRLTRRVGGSVSAGAAAGLVFAVLPIHTAVLNNVVGRADLLAAAGVLVTLLCHRHIVAAKRASCHGTEDGLRRNGTTDSESPHGLKPAARRELTDAAGHARRCVYVFCAGTAAFVAMGAKESGVSVLALVPLFDALWHWRAGARTGRKRWASWRTLSRLSYLVIPALCYFALRYHALGGHIHQRPAVTKTVNVLVDAPAWQHALGVMQLWGMYWHKTAWPAILNINYSINAVRLATGPFNPDLLIGVLVTILLAVFSITAWRRGERRVAVLSLAVAVAYAPTANALVLIQVFFAERIWYLPSIWVAMLVGLAAAKLADRRAWQVAGVVILLGMTARCWIRNTEWRHNGTLFASAYRDHPDAIGTRYRFGRWLVESRDAPEEVRRGIGLLQMALEIDPGHADAQRVLGKAYLKLQQFDAAIRHLQIAEMLAPGHAPTQRMLAMARRYLDERHDDALAELRARAANAPDDVAVQVALLEKLRELGRLDDALAQLREGEMRFAQSATWQLEYAVTLVYMNRRDEAIERYRAGVELAPENVRAVLELAMLLLERRQGEDLERAWTLVDRAETLAPGAPAVLSCRAELLALRGDLAGAAALYRRAIEGLPEGSEQRRMMTNRAKALGGG